MPYGELIKDFGRIRSYMREFYVFGLRSRGEYTGRSVRSYDNERRRVESWLGEYLRFRSDSGGRTTFLSVDSRAIPRNPLYEAFRAASFTDRDLFLHFAILDLLAGGQALPAAKIAARMDYDYLFQMDTEMEMDESTVRAKLKEYVELGLLKTEMRGRTRVFSRAESGIDIAAWSGAALFFSEAAPLGLPGAYLLDRFRGDPVPICFKHRYLLHVLDSEILCQLCAAIRGRRRAQLLLAAGSQGEARRASVCPAGIYVSVQSGREYLLAWNEETERPGFFRLDAIERVRLSGTDADWATRAGACRAHAAGLWGVSSGAGGREHLEMTIYAAPEEAFVVRRLDREKRCGRVERLDRTHWRFSADVGDAEEMLPWLRTFIGRITGLSCSNPAVTERFWQDLEKMRKDYGEEGGADASE